MSKVKKLKIGIIGFGSIGQRHFNNLAQYKPEITVFSKHKDVLGQAVNNWGDFKKFGPFDAIFVTNETHKHVPTIFKCLELKPRAIFVEKPISHSLDGLAKVMEEAKKKKISLWVGYNFQFYKPFLKIKEILKSRAIGKIYYARVSAGQDLREWRKRDYRLNYGAKKFQGGGVMLDLVHEINYAGWILGEK
ncbi:MAG: Gfo/Idh/MocA family oxidoreductase, partial [Patescibacteria group bacterium]